VSGKSGGATGNSADFATTGMKFSHAETLVLVRADTPRSGGQNEQTRKGPEHGRHKHTGALVENLPPSKHEARTAADTAAGTEIIARRPRNYTPTTHPVNAFKALAKLAYAKRTSDGPADGPLTVSITFIMPRPKHKVWKQKPMPRYCHIKKPDLDNLVKAVLDALNGLAWRDDAQIHTLHISKVVAAGDEQPRDEQFHVVPKVAGCNRTHGS
jgi:Holliday junction resolvase RusA-like endonuclease